MATEVSTAVHCRAIYCSTTCRIADASVHAELCAPEFALGEWRRRMSRGTSLFTAVLALKLLAHTLADRRRVADAASPDRERQGLPTYPPVYGSDDVHVREFIGPIVEVDGTSAEFSRQCLGAIERAVGHHETFCAAREQGTGGFFAGIPGADDHHVPAIER